MAEKLVVEPASVPDYPGSTSVARAEKSDKLIFPNVDSCLAIVLIMEDDAVIGAHVGAMGSTGDWKSGFNEFRPNENATAAVKEMRTLTNGKRILVVFTLGDGYYDRSSILADVTDKPMIVDSACAVDVTVDATRRVITVVANKGKQKKAEWKFADLGPGTTNI